jgi:hypothetical protein
MIVERKRTYRVVTRGWYPDGKQYQEFQALRYEEHEDYLVFVCWCGKARFIISTCMVIRVEEIM